MNYNVLRYFSVLAEVEHYTIAAARLGISQPSLSADIHNLEKALGGVKLFEKVGRNIRLTDEGRYYQENVDESKMLVELPKESYIPRFVELSSNEESELQEISDGESAIENTEYKRAILGTQYGTAVHKVMELLSFSEQLLYDENADFDSIYDTIQKEREQWISDGTVTKESIACVTNKKIIKFLKSDIAKRMIKANQEQKKSKGLCRGLYFELAGEGHGSIDRCRHTLRHRA